MHLASEGRWVIQKQSDQKGYRRVEAILKGEISSKEVDLIKSQRNYA